MLRAIPLGGRSLALKSVFLRMAGFALYTSPYPPFAFFDPTDLLLVPPRAAVTMTRATASSVTPRPSCHRLPSLTFGTCIVPPPFAFSTRAFVYRGDIRGRRSGPHEQPEERCDPVAGDEHPDDDRGAEDYVLPPDRDAQDQEHLVEERQRERGHPRRRRARQPTRERRSRDDDR